MVKRIRMFLDIRDTAKTELVLASDYDKLEKLCVDFARAVGEALIDQELDSPREYFRAQQILRDRRDLLDATERGCFVLMEMMKAYERRIRTDCRNQEELDKRPWECAEYLAAASYLRAVWPVSVPPTGAKHDPG